MYKSLKTNFPFITITLFFSFLLSCKGNPTVQKNDGIQWKILGDTVQQLGENLDCIFEDSRGLLWIGSNGEGLFVYDGKNTLHITDMFGLPSNYILNIQEDVHSRIWLTTREGYFCFNGNQFINYSDTIAQASFKKIDAFKEGLFFPHDTAVCYYDGKSFVNFVIHPNTYQVPTSNLYRAYGVYSTHIDDQGILWLGTQENGVAYGKGNHFQYLKDKNLAGPAVRIVYQGHNGVMWFGNNGGGLFRYDGKSLRNISQELKKENQKFLENKMPQDDSASLARVFDIKEDVNGNIWAATVDAGVWRFDGSVWKQFTMKDGLPSNSVWKMYENRNKELWFIVEGKYIVKMENEKFINVFK